MTMWKEITNMGTHWLCLFMIAVSIGFLPDAVANNYSSFTLKDSTSISQPIVILKSNSTLCTIYGEWNTSALITVQADTASPSNYTDVLRIISNYTENLEVNLEVYGNDNLARISNVTIRFQNSTGATFDQIIVNNGSITQEKPGNPYDLSPSETLYVDIINLQANTTGTSYIYTYLRIRLQDKTTYVLYTITFKFT